MVINTSDLKRRQRKVALKKRALIQNRDQLIDLSIFKILRHYKWFSESDVIASFFSINSEISTKYLNEFIFKSNKVLCLPAIHDQDGQKLEFYKYNKDDKLILGNIILKNL